jgi:acetoin utilization deacetylase AcuC-like enzyme
MSQQKYEPRMVHHLRMPLAITPQFSGLVVGGCYWTLRRLSDDAMIVLAPTHHHAKEQHLSGCMYNT